MTIDGEVMGSASDRRLRASRRNAIGLIELNRPAAHNALDDQLLDALASEIERMRDDASVRALVLTGTGRSFCSGDDLKAAAVATTEQFARTIRLLQTVTLTMLEFPKPLVAALNGPAFGGGIELVLACDARIATDTFECATPEARLGLTLTNAASVLLPALIGPARARRMLLGGARYDAQWCLTSGLIDELTSPEGLLPRAIAVAEELATGTPQAVAATKKLLNGPLQSMIAAALQLETKLCIEAHIAGGRDRVRAFLSGRRGHAAASVREET